MFYLSKETQHQANVAHIAYFPESDIDLDRLTYSMQELKAEKQWIPERFHGAIDSGTLYSMSDQWRDYLNWCEQTIATHQVHFENMYKNRLLIATKFDEATAEVFNDSLHDGAILNIKRQDGNVTLLIDMRGGFTPKAMIRQRLCRHRKRVSLRATMCMMNLSRYQMATGFVCCPALHMTNGRLISRM
ncbi:DUF4085 domain-containing protein [Solibacillus sp. MA9]|uniref:DUF4085 domain-containing protein n=1 Tax=Solibacillus palustris TaxID=2908203 RepID=A0ABS9UBV2_9BACL|nr:DUF4085 family protein [Solibacillus sp. MA9]MCH7321828.1 DUF4085 domain-containing protein [Solibacillus sp. MA9]